MTKVAIQEVLKMMQNGKEPFMTEEGWTEFWRLVLEDEQNVEQSA